MFMFINETEERGGCFVISDIIEISCKFFSADNVTTLIQVILDLDVTQVVDVSSGKLVDTGHGIGHALCASFIRQRTDPPNVL